ncbi:MAG TPA: transglutaminase family protein, partial [Opitutus sp.]|nr:transglutaminase family protein [Opitutus sp.]
LLLDAYLDLVPKIETTLAALDLRDVVLAGYAPPADAALPTLGIASDPGVLEINVCPCGTWEDYDRQLTQLYAAANVCGLHARKLQFNGREVGTGGGAHLVFGGPTPARSPFFTCCELLPSVVRYWQHHPSLSYAFTGTYLGPSSQAPRIDESTFEALYELEIACAGAETLGSPQNLELYDLLFRDLLMDRSGNTHRAEISVDKLWNPFSPNGRLGLVEFRAFETHPLPAVQSVIALFVRAILARLCAAPFRASFVRWAGELHDRFFLPAFVWEDLTAIAADLQAHGIAFDPEWLRPAWTWRFPALGEFVLGDRHAGEFRVEFRQALEAWPLLGESPNAGTVARIVDSSLDRIEARVSDARVLEGGLLLVNGLPCEFRPTSDGGAACGIRYRAFYLAPSLQPHVPAHAPLLLEWVDRITLKVVAAARWHVWNPRNEPYASAPADEAEAAQRRAERWQDCPATLGQPRFVPQVDFPPEGRHTLDLRRYLAQSR